MVKQSVDKALFKAKFHAKNGEIEEAKKVYQAVLQAFPRNKRAQQGLVALNKPKQSSATQDPPQDTAKKLLNLYNQGQLVAAAEQAQTLTVQYPESFVFWTILGAAQNGLGKFIEAAAAFKKVTELNPNSADGYYNTGNALKKQGKLEEAIEAYNKALAIKPDNADGYYNMGNALKDQGKLDEAIEAFNKTVAIKPDYVEAFRSMGNALSEQGKLEEAIVAFNKVLAIKPDNAEFYYNLGNLNHRVSAHNQVGRLYASALDLSPFDARYALAKLSRSLPIVISKETNENPLKSFDDELESFCVWSKPTKAELDLRENFGSSLPFYLAYYPENMVERLTLYSDAVNFADLDRAVTSKRKDAKIKIGIITGHLSQHSVFNVLTKGILSNLDRLQFSVHAYITNENGENEQIKDSLDFDDFFSISSENQKRDMAEKILADDLDVLWYPEVGMEPVTAWLSVQRLAPVQFASWGHPITTGFKNMDYFLSGELIEGVDSEKHYREKLIKFPGTGCVTEFGKWASKSGDWEKSYLHENELTFLIPQSPFKFHPHNDEIILQIAKEIPEAKFLLPDSEKFPGSIELILGRLKDRFDQDDVPFSDRFVTFPWVKTDEFLSLMEKADIYLDLPTFSGYTTAWLGINCGIPIVTFEGEFMRQRLASGLLRKIGITDTIAQSLEDYVLIARRLASLRDKQLLWEEYRRKIKNAAFMADNDLSVVRAFEKFVLQAVK
ncbi:tetratricopeptide repeat protein [Parasedimentitalea maritima]|uniref:protein O-GlcNAc transferase n=1 Tax=Parasedimentitalea maritima TaxID=2578117 RepID=A0A6A4RF83_9RHOB|nr:tetratricopeptide repeat protein [Zongyanglinia marina]KAE9631750.1 tetratricopeptide repeat protein [Zongyanglinia marina]